MNNNSSKVNPLTLFGFGGGLVILLGGLLSGNTALTTLGLLGGGGMGATGLMLQNKSEQQTTNPIISQRQTADSASPPPPSEAENYATTMTSSSGPESQSLSAHNQAGEFFDYFLPSTDDKIEIINRLTILFAQQGLVPQFCDRSGDFEETVTVTLPDGENRLVADIITEYKGRPKPPLFFDSYCRIRYLDKPGNVAADFTSPLILMVEGILLKLPNEEKFHYFDWEAFQNIGMVADGNTPVMDFSFVPDESSPDEIHLCIDILSNEENHIARHSTGLFCYFLARRFWQIELSSPKTSTEMGGKTFTSVEFDMRKFVTIEKQEIEQLIGSVLADESLNEDAFQKLVDEIHTQNSPFTPNRKTTTSQPRAISNLGELIAALELKAKEKDGRYILFTSTDNYVNLDGDQSMLIVISQDEKAEVVTINCPRLYIVPTHQQELFAQAAMAVQFRTKFLRYELDETDGEVRGAIELPYSGDRRVTPKQLLRGLKGIVSLVDEHDPFLRSVLTDNEIDYSLIFKN